jgi:hypothetical protein
MEFVTLCLCFHEAAVDAIRQGMACNIELHTHHDSVKHRTHIFDPVHTALTGALYIGKFQFGQDH